MLSEKEQHMQRISAEALMLREVVVVPRGCSVEWGAGLRGWQRDAVGS